MADPITVALKQLINEVLDERETRGVNIPIDTPISDYNVSFDEDITINTTGTDGVVTFT